MKKKIFAIAIVVILAISLAIVPFTMAGATDYEKSLTLENKDPSTWAIKTDGISGLLEYNTSGTSFEFRFTAEGVADGDYSLIYYTDTEDRFNDWGGADGIVIATVAVIDGAVDTGDMSVFLGTSLPKDADANAYFYDYTQLPDEYANGIGAKIWLVPTSVLTNGSMPIATWTPDDNWLFETDLITFEQLVSNPVGIAGTAETPMLVLGISDLPAKWYCTATYIVTVDADNPTDAVISGVYGKITGWDDKAFQIVYTAAKVADGNGVLGSDEFCGFWNGDHTAYYFGPSATNGDTYDPAEAQSFEFEVTPLKAGAFDIGIVLVSGIADPRT